jgi:N-methylhydantoinase A
VTFRLQAEIDVPRLELPKLARGDGRAERASKGERELFDIDADRFVRAKVYDRQKLMAGDRIAGPAVVDQFDATTLVPAGAIATVDDTATLVIERGEKL